MKRFVFIMALLITSCMTFADGHKTAADSALINAKDSLRQEIVQQTAHAIVHHTKGFGETVQGFGEEVIVPIIAIVAVFGFPIFILLIIFAYRNKERKARYALIEKALETGHDLPEGLFKNEKQENNLLAKGIMHISIGIGLGILLWFLTEEIALMGIGPLISIIGIGEIIIYLIQQHSEKKKQQIETTVEILPETKQNEQA